MYFLIQTLMICSHNFLPHFQVSKLPNILIVARCKVKPLKKSLFVLGIIGGDYDLFPHHPGGLMRPRFDPPGPGRFGGFPGPSFGGFPGPRFGGMGGGFGGLF